MVDPALVYVVGVTVLFFFWVYGIVAFVRDVKNKLIPAYRQYRRGSASNADTFDRADASLDATSDDRPDDEADERRFRELYEP